MKNLYICFTLFLMSSVFGQNQNAVWYFGDHVGLDFNTNPPTSSNLPSSVAFIPTEGCASVSDDNGNLLFFTDGITVWRFLNNSYTALPYVLNGNLSSAQNVIIVPKPNNPESYYIITINGNTGFNKGLYYSEIDLNNGNGVITNLNTSLRNHFGQLIDNNNFNYSEGITSTVHSNGIDYWMVVNITTLNSSFLYSYKITSSGIGINGNPNFNIANPNPTINNVLSIKISPDNSRIAFTNGNGALFLGSFNNFTGEISNLTSVGSTIQQSYGVEFSPNSQILYFTKHGTGGLSNVNVSNPTNVLPISIFLNGSLQLGKDSKIYCSGNLAVPFISVISDPNNLTSPQFSYQTVSLGGNFSRSGLPQWVHKHNQIISVDPCDDITGISRHDLGANGGCTFTWDDTADEYQIEVIGDDNCGHPSGINYVENTSTPYVSITTTNNFFSIWEITQLLQTIRVFRFRIKSSCGSWSEWCCYDVAAESGNCSNPFFSYPYNYPNGSCFYGNQPCNSEYNLMLTETVIAPTIIEEQASNHLTATNIISNGANVDYHAGEAVFLNPGFQAQSGSVFLAHIEECTNIGGKPAQQTSKTYNREVNQENLIENEVKKDYIIISPNPSSTLVSISLENLKMQGITVTSMDGRTMFTKNEGNIDIYKLDISNYIKGIYLVTVTTTNGKVVTGKIIKN